MKLDPEKFKLIPKSYNGNDFKKIQYEDKDLVKKLKGEFHIIDVKKKTVCALCSLQMITKLLTKSMNWAVINMKKTKKIFFFPWTKELHFSITKTF